MSEAIRFDPVGTIEGWEENEFGQYCFACDLEDAQAQLEAQRLRADTAEENRQIVATAYTQLLSALGDKDMSHSDALLRISAAEQRIAEACEIVRRLHSVAAPTIVDSFRDEIIQFLSAASPATINQQGEGE